MKVLQAVNAVLEGFKFILEQGTGSQDAQGETSGGEHKDEE